MCMNTKPVIFAFFLAGILIVGPRLLSQEKSPHTLPDDPTKAWAEVEKLQESLRPPNDWQSHEPSPEQVAEFQKQVRQSAVAFADKAQEFLARFPTNENVGDARIMIVFVLGHAVAAGDTNAEQRIHAFVSS